MNNNILNNFVSSINEQKLNVLNVVVRQNGNIVARHDFAEEKPALLHSVSKTFTSMAVGIAISEGFFKINDLVIDFFSDISDEYRSDYLKKMTIHDLLCMGTGHAECPVSKAELKGEINFDVQKLFFEEPIIFEPGTHFTYNNAAAYILSKIITITTDVNLDDYLFEKVFKPLEIPKPIWNKCINGIPKGFTGLFLTAQQLSKFGQLILDKGVWQGSQIIPSSYIEQATSVQIKTSDLIASYATDDHIQGYGYQIWINSYPNSYRMEGLNGQFVIILPDKNAVITCISDELANMSGILKLAWETILDKL